MTRSAALALGLLLLGTRAALADAPDPTPWVVKIVSSSCDQKKIFHGSGLLFQQAGKSYVVTSDHVILHENKNYCHSVWNPSFPAPQRAVYLEGDWGYGLGLLALPATPPGADWPRLSDFAQAPLRAGAQAVVTGFPWATQALVDNPAATVAEASSPQDFFVQVPEVVHLTNGQAEYGMSGGPVFTDDSRVAGILCYQKLETESGQTQNEIFAISAPVVRAWLERYFADPDHFVLTFFQTPENQAPGGLIVSGRFWLGYSEANSLNPATVSVDLDEKPYTSGEVTDPQGEFAGFFNYAHAHPGVLSLSLAGFRKGSCLDYPEPAWEPVKGLVAFLKRMEKGDARPVGMVSVNDWDKIVTEAATAAKTLDAPVRKLEFGQPGLDQPAAPAETQTLLSKLAALVELLQSADPENLDDYASRWERVPGRDVGELFSSPAYQGAWSSLARFDPVSAKAARDAAQKIFVAMDQLIY